MRPPRAALWAPRADACAVNKLHPGGGSSIFINAGGDTTEEFEAIHSKRAWAMLEEWYIGELAAPEPPPPTLVAGATPPTAREWGGPPALDARRRQPIVLASRRELSDNAVLLRFSLQSPAHVLNLPVGQHLFLAASVGGKLAMRAYTPVGHGPGFVDILLKVYRPDASFPAGGMLSQHLADLAPGDSVEAKGPLGHIEYLGGGAFQVHGALQRCSHVAAVAGGSGITPMYQLLVASLGDAADETRWALLFANRREEDVLLREELEALAAEHPTRFALTLLLSSPPLSWPGPRGRVSEQLLRACLPAAADDSVAFLCGPEGLQDASAAFLRQLGYADDRVHVF